MVGRWIELLPELAVAAGLALTYAAVLSGGRWSGRLARAAAASALVSALAATVWTAPLADDFLFGAYRIDTCTQFVKALVLVGGLAAVVAGRADGGLWSEARAATPFLRLAAVLALMCAASAADLLLLWVLFELATIARVIAQATQGRWSVEERAVRRLVAGWLPTMLVFGLGVVLIGARAETTRFADLEGLVPAGGLLLALVAILARAGAAPVEAAVALARGLDGSGARVLAAAAWWPLALAMAIRLAALADPAPARWAGVAFAGLAAVPAGLFGLVLARRWLREGNRRSLAGGGAVALALLGAALVWAPRAAAALP